MKWLKQITLAVLSVALLNLVGCAVAIHTKPASSLAVAEVKPQASLDELLAQLLPPELCTNVLKNIRFAFDSELIHYPEFHTLENIRRLVGPWYHINIEDGVHQPSSLRADDKYYTSPNLVYPSAPCFYIVNLHQYGHRLPSGEFVSDSASFSGSAAMNKFYDRHKHIPLKDFLAAFGTVNLKDARYCGHALYYIIGARKPYIKDYLERHEQGMTNELYGECMLIYKFSTVSFDVSVTAYTFRDASIAELTIKTEKKR